MKFTIQWLKDHLETKLSDDKIIENLTSIGLEVESFENIPNELDQFIVGKIVNADKHPNADRLKVCDVDIGKKDLIKVFNIFLDEIKMALKNGERVELRGWGIFYQKTQKSRNSRNPKTGEILFVPETKKITFKMSKNLKEKINE